MSLPFIPPNAACTSCCDPCAPLFAGHDTLTALISATSLCCIFTGSAPQKFDMGANGSFLLSKWTGGSLPWSVPDFSAYYWYWWSQDTDHPLPLTLNQYGEDDCSDSPVSPSSRDLVIVLTCLADGTFSLYAFSEAGVNLEFFYARGLIIGGSAVSNSFTTCGNGVTTFQFSTGGTGTLSA